MKTHNQGFSLVEAVIVTPLLVFAVVGGTQMFDSAAKTGETTRAKARCVDVAEAAAARIVLELRQSAAFDAAPTNPAKLRSWLLKDGIRFQRVVGVGTDPTDLGVQKWSGAIEIQWDPAARTIVRRETGQDDQILARGITEFTVAPNADGQLIVSVTAERRTTDGGTLRVTRTRRVTPRNQND